MREFNNLNKSSREASSVDLDCSFSVSGREGEFRRAFKKARDIANSYASFPLKFRDGNSVSGGVTYGEYKDYYTGQLFGALEELRSVISREYPDKNPDILPRLIHQQAQKRNYLNSLPAPKWHKKGQRVTKLYFDDIQQLRSDLEAFATNCGVEVKKLQCTPEMLNVTANVGMGEGVSLENYLKRAMREYSLKSMKATLSHVLRVSNYISKKMPAPNLERDYFTSQNVLNDLTLYSKALGNGVSNLSVSTDCISAVVKISAGMELSFGAYLKCISNAFGCARGKAALNKAYELISLKRIHRYGRGILGEAYYTKENVLRDLIAYADVAHKDIPALRPDKDFFLRANVAGLENVQFGTYLMRTAKLLCGNASCNCALAILFKIAGFNQHYHLNMKYRKIVNRFFKTHDIAEK